MENKKTKLLFVIYGLAFGGAEKSLVNLLGELDYNKFEVDLYIMDYYNEKTQKGLLSNAPKNVNIILPEKNMRFLTATKVKTLINNFSIKRFFFWFCSKLTTRFIKKQYIKNQKLWKRSYLKLIPNLEKEYDCAVAYMHSLPSYYVVDKTCAKRKILWVHTDYKVLAEGKKFDMIYFKKADNIVTISEDCRMELIKAFPNLNDKFKCLYNLSPINKIKQLADEYIPEEFNENSVNLLSIGRLTHVKGFDIAIKTAKRLKESGVKFKWVIIGEGELRNTLLGQIDDSIKNEIILVGKKANPYPYFKYCDIVIQPSRVEGKSIVIDEAKILEKPIICTNYNTVKDQIIDGTNGVIVPLEDFEALKDAIINLYQNKELKEKFIFNLKNTKFMSVTEYENLFIGEE